MAVAHRSEPRPVGSTEEAFAVLREHGMRASTARRLVLEALFAADGPITAERVADGVAGRLPQSDLASVYRNLDRLEEIGLVRHVHLGHGPGLYALAGPPREYLLCEGCGDVRAVDPALLDGVRAAIRDAAGYEARFVHFPIVGACHRCAARGDG